MATFKIHQDTEKENAAYAAVREGAARGKTVLQAANANAGGRSTFAVLSSVNNTRVGGGGGGVGAVNPKANALRDLKVGAKNDENAGVSRYQQKKYVGTAPVEQFKAFSVYEDENATIDEVDKVHKEPSERNRNVLKDVSSIGRGDSMVETPMSVTDVLSPMSIDRSQIFDDDTTHRKRIISSPVPRNDRERFFEVVEYQKAILDYFRESEKKHRPKPNYMRRQPDINHSMRTILVDWLVEVTEEYKLDTETFHLAVSYIDRFLSQMSVVRGKLQLVGTAAMYIASKYEEIYPPDVGEFVFITDDTYTKAQVLRMEQIILKILSFDLCIPTTYVFLNTYAVLYDMPDQVKFLAQYISELSLLEGDPYLRFVPSLISASALALARYVLDITIWCPELEEITTYKLEDMKEVIILLSRTHNNAHELPQQAIRDKYKDAKRWEVSSLKGLEMDEQLFDSIVEEYKLEMQSENSLLAADQANTSTTNESVRKMISSLMFV